MLRLLATEFAGDDPVPDGAEIVSVAFVVTRYATGIVHAVDADARVVLADGDLATADLSKTDPWPTSYGDAEYTDSSVTWTPALLNDLTTGFGLSARNPAAPGHPLLVSAPFVDVIARVVVYETA